MTCFPEKGRGIVLSTSNGHEKKNYHLSFFSCLNLDRWKIILKLAN